MLKLLQNSICFLLFAIGLAASPASALPVSINVGDFEGQWDVAGQTGALSGNLTVDPNTGNYGLRIGRAG